jgi:hypothetical protein
MDITILMIFLIVMETAQQLQKENT